MNTFVMECRIQEAKARVKQIAEASDNFADFEYDVRHDKAISRLLAPRYVKILIQQYAHILP